MLDNEYPPLGGGTGVVNQRILEHLSQREDVDADLVTSSRTRRQYEYRELSSGVRIHSVPVDNRNIHHSSNRELSTYAWRGWRYARRLAGDTPYDVCLAWAGVPAGGVALALKRELGLPYIVSLQGPDVPGFENRYRWVYAVLTPFIRLVWRRAGLLTACSAKHRELAHVTEPRLAIQVIPNGVDTDMFRPDPAGSSRTDPVRVICCGRLIERKGQQHLIPAIAELRRQGFGVELVLVGTGDNESRLRHQVRQLALEDAVHFSGLVPWETMPQLYRECDIFALPSHNEGMSIALLEAMATGMPVVVTRTGGVRELVDGNGLVVPWGSVPALTAALKGLVSSQVDRHRFGRRSRELASQFTWDKMADSYLRLCRMAAGATQDA